MRELTKSMMSFSWAMSLFGVRQMTCMLNPQSWGSTASTFENVTRSTEDQLGSTTQSIFRAGDSLQRGMVDMMFGLFSMGLPDSGSDRGRGDDRGRRGGGRCGDTEWRSGAGGDALRRSVEWGADVVQQTAQAGADVVRQSVGATSPAPAPASQGDIGWGPMPGSR